jgi:hypothetical protein
MLPDARSRLNKVKAMSFAEIVNRASYAAFLAYERRRIGGATRECSAGSATFGNQLLEECRRNTRPRFFAGTNKSEEMRALFGVEGPYARQAADARREALAASQHEFYFFGRRFSYGSEIDWNADPVTSRRWPLVFHKDVPQDSTVFGDIKYVWELNRHQFLIDLGKAYWLFGDAAAASSAYRILRSWIATNPYGIGVNWSCALEPAFRVWSWLWTYHFCMDDPSLDDETHAVWLGSLYEHGHFLHRHLEYYSSPYNHLIGEASALYALGVLFPEMPEAGRWRQRGRGVLESRLSSEFHTDGGSVEQSTFYHHATLGFYILAAQLGDANGDPFGRDVHAAIERGIDFSMALIQPNGRVPSIGGADDGKCIRMGQLPFWDFRAFQAFGAVRYHRADFRFAAGEFFEDALWLLGPDGRDRFLAMKEAEPPLSSSLPASGYFVLRNRWSSDADYLCFDCGEQAAGLRRDDVPSAAHGHADCLSIVLWLRGRPVLVDPGFYCYNGDPEWEVHFRQTAAHNTARVDRRDQSRHVHKMAWSHVFEPMLEAWLPTRGSGAVGGSHDGYGRDTAGVVHRRAVWLHPIGCCIVCDQFAGRGPHDVEINYQFAPGFARLCDDTTLLYENAEVAWTGSTSLRSRMGCGEERPDGGWIAPSLGIRTPAPRLTLSGTFTEPVATYLTVIVPPLDGQGQRTIVDTTSTEELRIGVRSADGKVQWIGLSSKCRARSARELITSVLVWNGTESAPTPSTAIFEHCG